MSTQVDQAIFQVGIVPARDFSEDCTPGDWETFNIVFPTPFPAEPVRVIVTANNVEVPRDVQNTAVVGLAQNVTPIGFTLAARNSDCARGLAGLNWMAVLETPGKQERPVDLRMGVVQPQHFQPDCTPGDWQSWGVTFSTPFAGRSVVLLTASNLNITPFGQEGRLAYHNAAAVGIVRDPTNANFILAARNSDCAEGDCAFYYVALSPDTPGNPALWVDTGEVRPQKFASSCTPGDWRMWNVAFNTPFLTPPTVLVTGNNRGVEDHNAAVVGIAQNVTTHGFTLAARNSDCASGQAGFYWVALGCAQGCG